MKKKKKKKVQWSIPGCLFFPIARKNSKLNLGLVVVLVLESEGLFWSQIRNHYFGMQVNKDIPVDRS